MNFRDSLRALPCDSVTDTLANPECRNVARRHIIGPIWGPSSRQKGAMLLQRMTAHPTVCLRQLAHGQRAEEVGFGRFLDNSRVTAERAKTVLAGAAMVTVMGDRESDIFAAWARVPEANVHLITRSMHDRRLVNGDGLYATAERFAFTTTRLVALPERERKRSARLATLTLRFGKVELARPCYTPDRDLPKSVPVTFIEVIERNPPRGAEPVHWRLLTTHEAADADAAWQIVDWYKMRWIIEQFWRLLKQQGLRLEDSQVEAADRLVKLAAIAAKAAVVILQLLQARNGPISEPASIAFTTDEIAVLERLNAKLEGKTSLQKNPNPKVTLRWAAWIIAKLGGWDGYPSSKPPGPITFKNGLQQFHAMVAGWSLKNVRMP